MNGELNYKSLVKIVVIGILLYCALQNYLLVLKILGNFMGLIFPFILGGAIAFVINVPMRAIEKRLFPKKENADSLRRILSYVITLILIISVLGLALFVIVPQISDTIKLIVTRVPSAFREFKTWLYQTTDSFPNVQAYIEKLDIDWSNLSSYAINFIKTAGSTVFTSGISFISGIVGGVANFVVAFIFSIYILLQKEKLAVQAKKALFALCKSETADRVLYILRMSNRIFSNFLSGQCLEAVILGTMFFVTLTIFQLPYAILIGVVIALTALIPIFGAFIGCAIGAFLIVMVNPMQALWFLVIFFVLQQIENNLIYPYVVGGSIGLPSIWVLVAVMIGGNLLGIAGILIFIPFCSVCYALFREYVYKRLQEKNIDAAKWETVPPVEIEEETPKKPRRRKKKSKKENEEAEEE